jgi:hypothetical protein
VEFTDSDKHSSLPRTIKTVAFSYSGVYKSQYLLWGKESPRVGSILNIRIECELLTLTNTPVYYGTELIAVEKVI